LTSLSVLGSALPSKAYSYPEQITKQLLTCYR